MPSRHSYVASSPLAPLSEIIKLEPEKEPWCAGYAPSQGRRCHARTNARGRSSAMMLLNEGTKDLRAGRSIDTLLEDLAPHVLCTRFHQSQASDLSCRWKRQVRTYLDSRVASTRSARPMRLSSRSIYRETAEDDIEERTALLYQRLHDITEEVRRLEVAQYSLSITANRPIHREGRNTSVGVSSSSAGSVSSRNTPPPNLIDRTVRSRSTESPNQSAITVPRPAQAQVSHQTRAVSVSSPRPSTPPTVVRVSSSTRNQDSQDVTPQANRREVEGECGICLCNLQISQQDVDTDEEEESESNDDDDDDDEEEDEEEDDDNDDDDDDEQIEAEDKEEHQDEELVWCKARCGVNFHKQCIDRWLETALAPTCPACRSYWKH
ncbi:uncharacterized protein N7446_002226 [Penicillium canescens]|uniref:RING-type domain-containing protein n=1 Tax=Penicillium canescens TaxID=5083 RepID=A0AAD6IDN5_PENCN|nr:uncharacterized protein N7446_002226 [Penicillium canescens]KAJ6044030.1 hypothetical protein N7460_005385 [Penicillium canescens]KAJ6055502.1 hypothetical protein N7444_004600 [Penicillium canescens]KAJ6074449.1 hypothetical protein N7446_002226 [Penicillium canescens]